MGTLIDTSAPNHDGQTCQVILDKDGYSSTVFSASDGAAEIESWQLRHGAQDAGFSVVRQNTNATIGILGDSDALFTELESVYGADRTFQLTLKRAGTTVFEGWLDSAFINTPRQKDQKRIIELRATPQAQVPESSDLEALNDDWVDSNGDRFTGTKTFAEAIADILQRTGFTWPIEAIIHWRPTSMSSTDDPLSIQFNTDAFYREGSDNKTRALSSGDVLEDLCGVFNAHIVAREDGLWRIVQAESKVNGSSNDVWEYDSSGSLKSGQPTTESTTIDLTNATLESDIGSPSVSGYAPINDSSVIYEYGPAVGNVDFQGNMEEVNTGTDLWQYYDNGAKVSLANANEIDVQTNSTYVRNGAQALEIEENQATAGTDPDDFTNSINEDYAEHRIGFFNTDIGGLKVKLRAMPRITDDDNDITTQPDTARAFWALRLEPGASGGNEDHFFVTDPFLNFGGWVLKSSLSSGDKYNFFDDSNFTQPQSYTESIFAVPQLPESGNLWLRLYHPVSRPASGNDGSGYTVYCNWDDVAFERNTRTAPAQTWRSKNQSVKSGIKRERTHRLGTGPKPDSVGYVLDNNGSNADGWDIIGQSGDRELQRLSALRLLRLREEARERWEPVFLDYSTEPKIGQAIEYDGTRYWPFLIEEQQPDNVFRCVLGELALGASSVDDEEFSGRSAETDTEARFVETMSDLQDTSFSQLKDNEVPTYDVSTGAFVLKRLGGSREEISSFRPGPLPQNEEAFSRLFISSFSVESIDIYAKTDPASDYQFAIVKNGNTSSPEDTITLSSGSNTTSKDLSFSLADGDRLAVIGNDPQDSALSDIMVVFDVSST